MPMSRKNATLPPTIIAFRRAVTLASATKMRLRNADNGRSSDQGLGTPAATWTPREGRHAADSGLPGVEGCRPSGLRLHQPQFAECEHGRQREACRRDHGPDDGDPTHSLRVSVHNAFVLPVTMPRQGRSGPPANLPASVVSRDFVSELSVENSAPPRPGCARAGPHSRPGGSPRKSVEITKCGGTRWRRGGRSHDMP